MAVPRSTIRVARTMALDAATAEVAAAFRGLGVPCMLLKGPAMAARLYADEVSQRNYTDIDLLVPPDLFAAAGSALHALGYRRAEPSSPSPNVGDRHYEEAWRQTSNPDLIVDLHRGFHGVGRQGPFWEIMYRQAESLRLGSEDVAVPGVAGCALLAALHVWTDESAQRPNRRPMADLERALEQFDDAVWRAASEMALGCDALPAFTIGLRKHADGVLVAQRLSLPTAAAPSVWLRSVPTPDGTVSIGEWMAVPSWTRRLALVPRLAFPSAEFMRGWARRHPLGEPPSPPGVAAAYAVRLMNGVEALPAAVRNWRSSSRAAVESGWTPPPPPLTEHVRRAARRGALLAHCPPLVVWARLAWQRVHRELPVAGLAGHLSTGRPPPSAALSDSQGDRVVRAVLRCSGASCLEEALVRQAWLARRGTSRDIVVGVTSPADGFKAHAWLSGDRVPPGYVDLAHKPLGGGVQPVRD